MNPRHSQEYIREWRHGAPENARETHAASRRNDHPDAHREARPDPDPRPRPQASPPENYQRYFVPTIGAPVAHELVAAAALRPGERVLDVGCGTGVVARLAAAHVGAGGAVAGIDIHPGMLAVAASTEAAGARIDWREADAESIPYAERSFDVVLCQMSLQFVERRLDALREMRRVLEPGGRALVCVPGPRPELFASLSRALARHFGPQPAAFAERVFSMHDVEEMSGLLRSAGFGDVTAEARQLALRLPAPAGFLWQYIGSTPLAARLGEASADQREAFERDVCAQWQPYAGAGGAMRLRVGITTARGVRPPA